MKTTKIIYWSATGLLGAMLLMSAGVYIFNNAMIQELYIKFGYPTYIIYPLAIAKIVAAVVLLTQKRSALTEWVYSALFFEFVLAFFAHYMIGDGEQTGAVIATVLLIVSYLYSKKLYTAKIQTT